MDLMRGPRAPAILFLALLLVFKNAATFTTFGKIRHTRQFELSESLLYWKTNSSNILNETLYEAQNHDVKTQLIKLHASEDLLKNESKPLFLYNLHLNLNDYLQRRKRSQMENNVIKENITFRKYTLMQESSRIISTDEMIQDETASVVLTENREETTGQTTAVSFKPSSNKMNQTKSSIRNSSEVSTHISDGTGPQTSFIQKTSEIEPESCWVGSNQKRYLSTTDGTFGKVTCFLCYLFVPPHRKKSSLKLDYKQYSFYPSNSSTSVVPLDPTQEDTWAIVAASMVDRLEAEKLADCCSSANSCCSDILAAAASPSLQSCPSNWDGWSCFLNPSPPGGQQQVRCPSYAYTGYPECYLSGVKSCDSSGAWEQKDGNEYTDYSDCSMRLFHTVNYAWECAMHAVSLLALTPAVVCLLACKALHLPRFYMHLHFFLALWLRSSFKIMEVTIMKFPETLNVSNILEDNAVWCRVLVTCSKMAMLSVWAWMMAECIFLYRLIARAFNRPTTVVPYVVTAWGGSAVLAAVWAVCRALLEDYQCWLGDMKEDGAPLHLVTDVAVLIVLLVNIGLLVDMVRIMFTQLRGRGSDPTDVNRATLFLVPLFGLQFLVTVVAPTGASCATLQIYLMIANALTGLQGLYVSIFYCYRNTEVQKQLALCRMKFLNRYFPSLLPETPGRDPLSGAQEPLTTYSTVQTAVDGGAAAGDLGTDVELVPLGKPPIET